MIPTTDSTKLGKPTSTSSSTTPRTDAYVEFWLKDRIALWPDFARKLEQELNELHSQVDRSHQGSDRQDAGNQTSLTS